MADSTKFVSFEKFNAEAADRLRAGVKLQVSVRTFAEIAAGKIGTVKLAPGKSGSASAGRSALTTSVGFFSAKTPEDFLLADPTALETGHGRRKKPVPKTPAERRAQVMAARKNAQLSAAKKRRELIAAKIRLMMSSDDINTPS